MGQSHPKFWTGQFLVWTQINATYSGEHSDTISLEL